ncbi:MAG: OmpP1/FadL family transporter [Candidatus Methylomirabilis sp.]
MSASPAYANGIYRNGMGARAMALGGADVALAEDPLSAMAANPAGLAFLKDPTLQLSLAGAFLDGKFTNPTNTDGQLDTLGGIVPDVAFGYPLRSLPVTLGFAITPNALLKADWRYVDTPGGLDGVTTYGLQRQRSEIIVLRSAAGVGVSLTPWLSLGGSLGLIYNKNSLEAPYIFQSQPTLKGFKTLVNLGTEGFGWNGTVGLLARPHKRLQVGVTYTSRTVIHSEGDISGNASAQLISLGPPFSGARPDFHYDAEVRTVFPQMVSGGVSWQAHPRLRLALQADWIDWSDAFDRLPIKLTNGNNADINALVGSSSLEDVVPLNWKDRVVYRAGLEYAVSDTLWLRGGYSYGKSPVPDGTLTPLTAAITEHTVTAGVGYRAGRYQIDFAYQWDLPTTQRIGVSQLRSGEYSNSSVEIGIHWVGITISIRELFGSR